MKRSKPKGMHDLGQARVRTFNDRYKDEETPRDEFIRAAAELFCHRGGLRRSKDYTVKAGGRTLRVCALELHHVYRHKQATHKFLAAWDSSTQRGVVYDEVTVPRVLRHHLETPEVAASKDDTTFLHTVTAAPVAANDDALLTADEDEVMIRLLHEKLGPPKGHELKKVPGLRTALQKLCNGNMATVTEVVLIADAFQHRANHRPRLIGTSSDVMRTLVRDELPEDVLGEVEEKLRPRLERFKMKGLGDAAVRHREIHY